MQIPNNKCIISTCEQKSEEEMWASQQESKEPTAANCQPLGEKKKEGGGAVKAVLHDSNVTVIVHKWENGMRISRKHKRMEIFWSEDTAAMTTKKSVCV